MTYQFDTDIAEKYGVDEAIVIYNFDFWIRKNEANGKHFHDGRCWTYNSIDALVKLFPFWSARQLRRILKSLEDKGVIITGNYNASAYDRTTWYAFADSFVRNGQIHLTETSNGNDETVRCIITDNKPNQKPNEEIKLFSDEEIMTVTKPRRTGETRPILFAESRFSTLEKFLAEFTAPEFANVDIDYYFHAVADWSAQGGKKKRDWIATARNFIRSDMERGKLHTLQHGGGLSPDAVKYLQMMSE